MFKQSMVKLILLPPPVVGCDEFLKSKILSQLSLTEIYNKCN